MLTPVLQAHIYALMVALDAFLESARQRGRAGKADRKVLQSQTDLQSCHVHASIREVS